GEAESDERVDADVASASRELRDALTAIEPVARELPDAPFADIFVAARGALDGQELPTPLNFLQYTDLAPAAARLLKAAGRGWVFGAMGSWNDIVPSAALKSRYEETSKALFAALQRAVLVAANSTYRA